MARRKEDEGRLGNNEGAIYETKEGRWRGFVSLGWQDGRWRRKYVSGKTKTEVRSKVVDLRRELEDHGRIADDRLTVGAFLDRWLEHAEASVRSKTYDSYEGVVRLHLKPKIGRYRIAELTVGDVERMLRAKKDEGLSAKRIQLIRDTLRTALNAGIRWGEIRRNPAQHTSAPRGESREMRVLSAKEAKALLETASGDRLEQQSQERLKAKEWADDGWVFTTKDGAPLDPDNVTRSFAALTKKAKIENLRLHDLRHSCASFLLAEGVPARVVMDILGHSQVSLTLDTYTHVSEDVRRGALQVFDGLFPD